MFKALDILTQISGKTLSSSERVQKTSELASIILTEALHEQSFSEKLQQAQLARMMQDPTGKNFTTSLTDQCFRSRSPERVANQMVYLLSKYGIPSFLSFWKRLGLHLVRAFGNLFPTIVVPIVKEMVRRETAKVILPGEPKKLSAHIRKRIKEGITVNLNHLGEAILGEEEAQHRLNVYLQDLANPEVQYISVKVSTISSQINLLAWDETLKVIKNRLRQLYEAASKNFFLKPDGSLAPKFVNLDMEEFRDLYLTVEAFQTILNEPEFNKLSAGIVLQSYIPESFLAQKQLTEWAKIRIKEGGAPIKIRIVKGANLAMEQVEASLKGWPQAPYLSKVETDANFKKMLLYGCQQANVQAVHLGIASHNLFDIALGLILRAENQIEPYVTFEMLEGMADPIQRVVHKLAKGMVLYCPAATQEEFQNAVAYLIRRLDENTAPENFLHDFFGLTPGSKHWHKQENLFKRSLDKATEVSDIPRRQQNRRLENFKEQQIDFQNEPDTDWSLSENRLWGQSIIEKWKALNHAQLPLIIDGQAIITDDVGIGVDPSNPRKPLYKYSLANSSQIDGALSSAKHVQESWQHVSINERFSLLGDIANNLRRHRDDLIGVMVADTGKIIYEADVEVSEAIDFAEYYRRNLLEVNALKDIAWKPKGVVLVAPPWNFPCSIPAGGILAALAAGNCVLFKPAPEAVLVGWKLVNLFWEAGVSKQVLQFITCDDEPAGSLLIKDPRLDCIVLTGATATAKLFLGMRTRLNLVAETGGKNAIIVSNLSDRDLAVKDIIQSAFGHAGQKCSACSLVVCLSEVYEDPQFRKQLRDAAASLTVGSQWELMTKVNPLIRSPNATLLRGLTSLEEGEEWLLKPEKLAENLWSPGIKMGVKAGSFTHQNELFGPVLGIMKADNLMHAITLVNSTPYGLTSGLHSLDEREHKIWLENIQAGNCYINRGVTGAIVRRQPFGGCKESSFGPGAKAGGPNYLMQLMVPQQVDLPPDCQLDLPPELLQLKSLLKTQQFDRSLKSYYYEWVNHFSRRHDPSQLLGQDNLFYYIPHKNILCRLHSKDVLEDILRVIAAVIICGATMEISCDPNLQLPIISSKQIKIVYEAEDQFVSKLKPNCRGYQPLVENAHFDSARQGQIEALRSVRGSPSLFGKGDEEDRFGKAAASQNENFQLVAGIRLLSEASEYIEKALASAACSVHRTPVMANGRIELLHYMREVNASIDTHRYGYIGNHNKRNEDSHLGNPSKII